MLFRIMFKKLAKDAQTFLKKKVDRGEEINISKAIRSRTITRGLKYAMATGNWGEQKNAKKTKSFLHNKLLYTLTCTTRVSSIK